MFSPEDKGVHATEENPGESMKPRVLLKPKSRHARPDDEVFLSVTVCVCMTVCTCRYMYTNFMTKTVFSLLVTDLI